jgi:hypothetical protein
MGLTLLWTQGSSAGGEPPQYTQDGLHLEKQTKQRLVYVKPGATFSRYRRVAIRDCYVEFQKDWQREYNQSHANPEGQVTFYDAERIRGALAAEFTKVFSDELQSNGGYQVVHESAADVLLLRPALINVQITAPDLKSPGIEHTVIRSAGQMTLQLELWDPLTSTILARVMDTEADQEAVAQEGNAANNKAAADAIIQRWAQELRKYLDAVRASNARGS